MADLNSLIAQGAQFNVPDQLGQFTKYQQIQQGMQTNQMNQLNLQEKQRGLQEQNALRNVVGQPGFDPMNPTHQAAAYSAAPTLAPKYIESALMNQKTVKDIGKTGAETAKIDFETQFAKSNDAITQLAGLSTPKEAIDSIDAHVAKGELTADKAAALKNSLTTAPSFAAWKNNALMGTVKAQEQLTLTAPKLVEQRRGDVLDTVDLNSLSPTYMQVVSSKPINMTAFEKADLPIKQQQANAASTSAGAAAANAKTAQGQLAVSQQRLAAEMATGNLTPDTIDFVAETYRQTGQMPPLGMGPMAATARSKILSRAAELSMSGGQTAAGAAADVSANKAETAGRMSGSRAIGTQIANIQVASNEASKMIGIARSYVDKVNPTDYPTLNAAGNFVAKNTGDPNIVGLATSLNAAVNIYARAINPKGVGTVSDKNHAREILNAAMSKGQLNEAFSVMEQEMAAARASGPETRAAMRPGAAPAAAPATTVAPNIDALLNKYK